ncbi:MAG: class I SAM-dependent methyltransferase [Steroidobacteraceae bacterium]
MGVYRKLVVPRLCDFAMRSERLFAYRERTIAAATGRVLEIGAGAGCNLRHYPPQVREVLALEPDRRLIRMARRRRGQFCGRLTYLESSAEAIPLGDQSVDTVVSTWTMCTIPHVRRALLDVRRVLVPGGRLLFVEHGLSPEPYIRKWQYRVDPLWARLSGGCHLDRPIQALIEGAGFAIEPLRTGYMSGPKLMTFLYEGAARPL